MTGHPGRRRRVARLAFAGAVAVASAGCMAVAAAGGPAGADTTLGGFTVTADASGLTASYEQPNLPLPANPSAEVDVGYTATADNVGPSGSALASSLYPGQVVANAGPELGEFLPGVPLPAAPVWPVQATSTCPQGPDASLDPTPGVTMDAACTSTANTATATFGSPGATTEAPVAGDGSAPSLGLTSLPSLPTLPSLGSSTDGDPAALTGALLSVDGLSSTSSSGASGPTATATATATASGISLLGGLVTVGSVTSTATATSNGTTGTVSGTSVVHQVVVADQPVTVDGSGVHAAGSSAPLAAALPQAQSALTQAGITLTVTDPTDVTQGPQASRRFDGLRIEVNLTTLDKDAAPLSALIPASVLAELPVPLPDAQIIVLDVGWVDVASDAAPAYVDGSSDGSSATAGDGAVGALAGGGGTGDLSDGSTDGTFGDTTGAGDAGSPGFGGTDGTPGTAASPGTGGGSGSGTPGTSLPAATASASLPFFRGIGGGLLAAGLLAAAAVGFAYLRAQSAMETAGGPTCAAGGGPDPDGGDLFGGDPLYRGIELGTTGT